MKKIFGILAVSAFLFASCGGNTENAEATDTTAAPAVEEVVVEEEPVMDSAAVAEEATTEVTEEVAA